MFRRQFFRAIVIGSSQSGKTYFVINELLKQVYDLYTDIVIMTKSHNNNQYRSELKKRYNIKPRIVNKNFKEALQKIVALQKRNVKGIDKKTGHPVYKSNILIIWDDILDEKLFKDNVFQEQFTNLRHLQISTVVLSQISNKIITPQIKSNTNFFVLFRINDVYQKRLMTQLIMEALLAKDPNTSDKDLRLLANRVYMDMIMPQYKFLVIDDSRMMSDQVK